MYYGSYTDHYLMFSYQTVVIAATGSSNLCPGHLHLLSLNCPLFLASARELPPGNAVPTAASSPAQEGDDSLPTAPRRQHDGINSKQRPPISN